MNAAERPSLGRVWILAWPIILSNVTTPLLGMVDTAVVGHLPGPEHIGGVAIGALVFTSVFWLFGFLRMGTSGFAAQAAGAEDAPEIAAVLGRAILLAAGLGLILLALQAPIWWAARDLFDASAAVQTLAGEYFFVRIWCAPATLMNYALLGWFIGLQHTRVALLIQLWLNGVNIVLDLVFVVGLDMGVPGVAWATLAGEWSAAALGLVVAGRIIRRRGATLSLPRILDIGRLRRFFRANMDIMIRTACLIFSFAFFTREAAQFGDLALAANAVLLQMVHMTAYGLDGFAFAAEALVGAAIGRRSHAALRGAVVASTILAGIVAVAIALAYLAAGDLIIALMTDQAAVRATAGAYLPWVALYPLVAIWCFQLDGVFIGATQTADMRNAMLASLAIYMAAALTLPAMWGNHGLWAALTVLNLARGATLAALYPRVERRAASAVSPGA